MKKAQYFNRQDLLRYKDSTPEQIIEFLDEFRKLVQASLPAHRGVNTSHEIDIEELLKKHQFETTDGILWRRVDDVDYSVAEFVTEMHGEKVYLHLLSQERDNIWVITWPGRELKPFAEGIKITDFDVNKASLSALEKILIIKFMNALDEQDDDPDVKQLQAKLFSEINKNNTHPEIDFGDSEDEWSDDDGLHYVISQLIKRTDHNPDAQKLAVRVLKALCASLPSIIDDLPNVKGINSAEGSELIALIAMEALKHDPLS